MPRARISYLFATLLLAASAAAQGPATFAEIDVGLEVYRVAELRMTPIDFGTLLIAGEGGSVFMDNRGHIEVSGGIHAVDGPAGAAQPGTLTLDAAAGLTAAITLPAVVDLGDGITYSPALESPTATMTGSPVTVRIFGNLDIPAGARSGSYGGVLAVDVSYN